MRAALAAHGIADVEFQTVYSPAWTTDWIPAEAREKLRALRHRAAGAGGAGRADHARRGVARRSRVRTVGPPTPNAAVNSDRRRARRSTSATPAGSRSTNSSRSDSDCRAGDLPRATGGILTSSECPPPPPRWRSLPRARRRTARRERRPVGDASHDAKADIPDQVYVCVTHLPARSSRRRYVVAALPSIGVSTCNAKSSVGAVGRSWLRGWLRSPGAAASRPSRTPGP